MVCYPGCQSVRESKPDNLNTPGITSLGDLADAWKRGPSVIPFLTYLCFRTCEGVYQIFLQYCGRTSLGAHQTMLTFLPGHTAKWHFSGSPDARWGLVSVVRPWNMGLWWIPIQGFALKPQGLLSTLGLFHCLPSGSKRSTRRPRNPEDNGATKWAQQA